MGKSRESQQRAGSGRLLIEGNIITRARDSAGSADSRAKNLYDDSIFRHNLVFDNLHIPLNTFSYTWGGIKPTSPLYRGPFEAMNSRFYHNTIVENPGCGWELGGVNVSLSAQTYLHRRLRERLCPLRRTC